MASAAPDGTCRPSSSCRTTRRFSAASRTTARAAAENLLVVLHDDEGRQDDKEILGGIQNYGSGFLPATYQGTMFRQGDTPILNLKPPAGTTDAQQRTKLEFLRAL